MSDYLQGGRGPQKRVNRRLVDQRGGYMNGRFFGLIFQRKFFEISSAKKWGESRGPRPPNGFCLHSKINTREISGREQIHFLIITRHREVGFR